MENFLLNGIDINLFVKIPILILIVMYALFALILFNKVKSLGKIVFIERSRVTFVLDSVAFFHFVASVGLFFFAIVIL